MALRHVFTTVRFHRGQFGPVQLEATRRAFADLQRRVDRPMLLTLEQKGAERSRMGAAPHLHLVALYIQGGDMLSYNSVLSKHFAMDDIKTERVNNYRVKHLVQTFLLKMDKAGRSKEEKSMTRQWRRRHGISPSMRHKDVVAVVRAF